MNTFDFHTKLHKLKKATSFYIIKMYFIFFLKTKFLFGVENLLIKRVNIRRYTCIFLQQGLNRKSKKKLKKMFFLICSKRYKSLNEHAFELFLICNTFSQDVQCKILTDTISKSH